VIQAALVPIFNSVPSGAIFGCTFRADPLSNASCSPASSPAVDLEQLGDDLYRLLSTWTWLAGSPRRRRQTHANIFIAMKTQIDQISVVSGVNTRIRSPLCDRADASPSVHGRSGDGGRLHDCGRETWKELRYDAKLGRCTELCIPKRVCRKSSAPAETHLRRPQCKEQRQTPQRPATGRLTRGGFIRRRRPGVRINKLAVPNWRRLGERES